MVVWLIVGLGLLVGGGEALVRGASRLATSFGISPLVVGLTVVAFGTSSPELAVSLQAALDGRADLAVGNVVGSNIFNVLFILGLSALIVPLAVQSQLVRFDVPIMIGVSIVVLVLGWGGEIGRLEGAVLFAGLLAYTLFLIRAGRREAPSAPEDEDKHPSGKEWIKDIGWIVAGLVLLVFGSRLLVSAAVAIARGLGISELIIGLTIVAAGTSLPEVAASLIAAWRGERDIAVGNVVGSNIFNILGVLGLSGLVSPSPLTVAAPAVRFDVPVMVAVAVACLPILYTGKEIARWEGGLFLAYYAAYTLYLILAAVQHDSLPAFSSTMTLFVLPITAVTLLVLWWRDRRAGPAV